MANVNLLSKQDIYRGLDKPDVKLGVYSPTQSEDQSFAAAKAATFKPVTVGESFGPPWSTHWFKVDLRIPEAQKEADVVEFHFDCEGEGFVYDENGTPMQGLTGGTVDRRIEFIIPKTWLSTSSLVHFYIEVGLNGMFGNGLALPLPRPDPERRFKLCTADLVVPNLAARRLLWDVQVIKDAIEYLPEHSYAAQDAITAASSLMDAFKDGSDESIENARAHAREILGDHVDSHKVYDGQDYTVTGIGHCHIDTAWLWPYKETRRKIGRSWAAQCDLLDRYPEHRMCVSQAQQFKWLQEDYPSLWSRILLQIQKGVFQPIGGTWIEMDTNLPSGESLIRQFLYGQKFFVTHFGARSQTFWLPDTFGYSAQLPQIARLCGIENFFTQKLSWNNINTFPRTTFNWVGLDGSQLLTHMSPCENYCSRADITDLINSMEKHKDLRYSKSALIPYGFGDGGGGPTPQQLEKLRRFRGLANKNPGAIPKHTVGISVDSFFNQIRQETCNGKNLDSFYGELYLEFHRGTYTSESFVKKCNRQCERLLHDLELLATIAASKYSSFQYPYKEIAKIWEDVLLNQFHDVLPGSSIETVYHDVHKMYKTTFAEIEKLFDQILSALSVSTKTEGVKDDQRIVILNTMPWDRFHVFCTKAASQSHTTHNDQCNLVVVDVPAYGMSDVFSSYNAIAPDDSVVVRKLAENTFTLTNGLLSLTIEGHLITSLIDLTTKRQLVTKGMSLNRLVLFDDRPPGADAWDVEMYHLECMEPVTNGSAHISLAHELRSSVTVHTKISDASWIKSTISLNYADHIHPENNLIEIECEVDWHENRKFLKTEFPVQCSALRATYETQFGVIERPTHFNTSWDAAKFEVCSHKFADLSESKCGISIVNDSKYGFATHGSTMRLSLLRSTKAPNVSADMGQHHFRYGIFPHSGNFQSSSVPITRTAFNFNNPLRALVASSNATDLFNEASCRLIRVLGATSVILDTMKVSEDGSAVIARLYESSGGHADIQVSTALNPSSVSTANALEDPLKQLVCESSERGLIVSLELGPFEIITLRFELGYNLGRKGRSK